MTTEGCYTEEGGGDMAFSVSYRIGSCTNNVLISAYINGTLAHTQSISANDCSTGSYNITTFYEGIDSVLLATDNHLSFHITCLPFGSFTTYFEPALIFDANDCA